MNDEDRLSLKTNVSHAVHEQYEFEVDKINEVVGHTTSDCEQDLNEMRNLISYCYVAHHPIYSKSHERSLYVPSENYSRDAGCYDVIGKYKTCLLTLHQNGKLQI